MAGRSSNGTASCARSARRARHEPSSASGTRPSSMPAATIVAERRRLLGVLADPLAAAHAEIAPDEASAARLALRYVTNAPPLPGEIAARRAGPPARRDGRKGGLERIDARRPAPRRPGVRARRPRPGGVRLARPAADGDPRVQAGRARRPDRAGRTSSAAPARRRLLGARPRPPIASRPPDRRAAPGLRDDDDPRRPRSGPPRDRDGVGGQGRCRRARRSSRARTRPRGTSVAAACRPVT